MVALYAGCQDIRLTVWQAKQGLLDTRLEASGVVAVLLPASTRVLTCCYLLEA
jgi:hypothetical protein